MSNRLCQRCYELIGEDGLPITPTPLLPSRSRGDDTSFAMFYLDVCEKCREAGGVPPEEVLTSEGVLLAIYSAYESMRYYEHQHKTELPAIRRPLESVLEKLTLEQIAWLHENSIATDLKLIEERSVAKLSFETYHEQRVRRSQR